MLKNDIFVSIAIWRYGKMYLENTTLKMIFDAQRGVESSHGNYSYAKQCVLDQTYDTLKDVLSGATELKAEDMDTIEALAYSYIKSVHGDAKKEAIALAEKIVPLLHHRKENLKKLADFDYVAYVLNNKKRAVQLSPQELMAAKSTVANAPKDMGRLKQRLAQQLQSYALLKYAALDKKDIKQSDICKEFIQVFGLSHAKRNTAHKPKTVIVDKKDNKAILPKAQSPKVSLFSNFKALGKKIRSKFGEMGKKVKDFYHKHEYKFIGFSLALLGFATYKDCGKSDQNLMSQQQKEYAKTYEQNAVASVDTTKTADFVKEQKKIKQSEAQKTIVGESYYDTALLIHLKTKSAVQGLYDKIDSLHTAGKISFENGLDTKRYAHSFTMYNLIRPNSKENKAIQNLLNGGQENSDYIKNLVEKAGEKGTGVKPDNNSIKTSNFDKASSQLQQMHLENLKNNARN